MAWHSVSQKPSWATLTSWYKKYHVILSRQDWQLIGVHLEPCASTRMCTLRSFCYSLAIIICNKSFLNICNIRRNYVQVPIEVPRTQKPLKSLISWQSKNAATNWKRRSEFPCAICTLHPLMWSWGKMQFLRLLYSKNLSRHQYM